MGKSTRRLGARAPETRRGRRKIPNKGATDDMVKDDGLSVLRVVMSDMTARLKLG
jgi:hypothetical protein